MIYAVALAGAAVVASFWAAPGLEGAAGAALACLMAAIAVSDWRRFRVPDALSALAFVLRGLDILVSPGLQRAEAALDALFRALLLFAVFHAFRALYGWLRRREGMGLGDVKLAGVAGAWIGWPLLPWVIEAAAVVGFCIAFARRKRAGPQMRLPFAVGFAPAIWFGWWLERLGV